MISERACVLLLERELEAEPSLRTAAGQLALRVQAVSNIEIALTRLQAETIAGVVINTGLESERGMQALQTLRRHSPEVPILLIAKNPPASFIVAALKAGATDFLSQPVQPEEWQTVLMSALKPSEPSEAVPAPSAKAVSATGAFMGKNPGMALLKVALPQVAMADVPVLIQGETGSGKEVIARELHMNSPRAKKSFVKLNCAALPAELVESELFGYERGAFTGAFQRKPGIFEAANGGTILLDEIGDMDVRLQAKLLQVLQDHSFQRIGGRECIEVDVRVIAATHRDLEKSIQEKTFREDLYYRLNVVTLVVPPLRERVEDLFDLMDILLRKHAKTGTRIPALTPDLKAAMTAWHWPGNVRELENFARRLLVMQNCESLTWDLRQRAQKHAATTADSTSARPHLVPTIPRNYTDSSNPPAAISGLPAGIPILAEVKKAKEEAEAAAILGVLKSVQWNRRTAAALLNTDYKCLLYRMKKLGMNRKDPAPEHARAASA